MDDGLGPLYEELRALAKAAEPAPAPEPAPKPLTPPAIMAARAQLNPVRAPSSVWPMIGAACLCAGSAMALVCAVILGPPNLGPDVTAAKSPPLDVSR